MCRSKFSFTDVKFELVTTVLILQITKKKRVLQHLSGVQELLLLPQLL